MDTSPMQASCLQENLAKGLGIVGRAVAGRSTLPVLSNVLLTAEGDSLVISATNLELGIICRIPAKVAQAGAVTIPARLLGEYINSLPSERIDLALDVITQTLNLRCARFESNIKGIEAGEFPAIPETGSTEPISLDPTIMGEMIEQVGVAVSLDESRPTLAGALLQLKPGSLTMAAADGFRLAVKTAPIDYEGAEVEVIVPGRALGELARASKGQEAMAAYIEPGAKRIIFRLDNITLVSQLIEGRFPDYTQIIPKGYAVRATMDTAAFLKAVRVAHLFARDSANIVRIEVNPPEDGLMDGRITLVSISAELGNNAAEVDAAVEGSQMEIAFNTKYLSDVLGIIETHRVVLEVTTGQNPGVIRPIGDGNYTHVIMPMHMNG